MDSLQNNNPEANATAANEANKATVGFVGQAIGVEEKSADGPFSYVNPAVNPVQAIVSSIADNLGISANWKPVPNDPVPLFPAEIKQLVRWGAYRLFWNEKLQKYDKKPFNAETGVPGNLFTPGVPRPFDVAVAGLAKHHFPGLGIGFQFDDGISGIDLDNVRNPETGEIVAWAMDLIRLFNSYTEVSVSKTGVHILVRGTVTKGTKYDGVEVYSAGRFFVVTGLHLAGTPLTIQPYNDIESFRRRIEAREFAAFRGITVEPVVAANYEKKDAVSDEKLEMHLQDMRGFLRAHGIPYTESPNSNGNGGGVKFLLSDGCVFDETHNEVNTTAVVFVTAAGVFGYDCKHHSCEKNTWKEFRDKVDPFHTYLFSRPDGKRPQMGLGEIVEILTTPSTETTPTETIPTETIPTETTSNTKPQVEPQAAAPETSGTQETKKKKTAQQKLDEMLGMELPESDDVDITGADEILARKLFSIGTDDAEFEDRLAVAMNDSGQAARFVKQFSHLFLYETEYWENWIAFNGTRWEADNRKRHVQAMKESVDSFAKAIKKAYKSIRKAFIENNVSKDRLETLANRYAILREYCNNGLSAARINAALSMTAGTDIYVGHDRFDTDKWLFNVANGTIDLKTGKLRDHNASDYLTEMSKVVYDETATCPMFLKFLHDITGGDEETIKYIRRLFFYCLTGDISEQAFFIFWGIPGSGKSTLLMILLLLLGDYAKIPMRGMFVDSKKDSEGPQPGMVHLVGARAVICHELKEKTILNTGLLTDITGDGIVSTRGMYETVFSFDWQGKVIFSTNHLPEATDFSGATTDRKKIVEFKQKFRGTDQEIKGLHKKIFAAEPAGILNWALGGGHDPVDGYFAKGGLKEPKSVQDRVAEDDDSQNEVKQWLGDECELGLDYSVVQSVALQNFNTYAAGKGKKPKDEKALTERLRMLVIPGFGVPRPRDDSGKKIRTYTGFRLASPSGPPSEPVF